VDRPLTVAERIAANKLKEELKNKAISEMLAKAGFINN